jgi:hypoxanthine phosphoribosyltransferase
MTLAKELSHVSWQDIHSYNDNILTQLKDNNIVIDSILGVARGGMIPATMLAYQLETPYLDMLGVRTRDVDNTQFYGNPNMFGNVLVVDDINDSGKTFNEIKKYLDLHFDRGEIKNVYYCACIKRASTEFETGFYGVEFEGDNWYVFPWDKD